MDGVREQGFGAWLAGNENRPISLPFNDRYIQKLLLLARVQTSCCIANHAELLTSSLQVEIGTITLDRSLPRHG
jgi:hypothetical protein